MKIKKSAFDLTHSKSLTCGYKGMLYPILCEALVPGDSFKGNTNILARVTPLVQPIYGRFDIRTDFFFVPNRLVWDNWQKFISPEINQDEPVFPCFRPTKDDSTGPINLLAYNLRPGTLADYLGCGVEQSTVTTNDSDVRISLLPFRAYHLIWNEFYRDQDLQEPLELYKGDGYGGILNENTQMRYANWEKDYFTTARPWAQKGSPASVPVSFDHIVKKEDGGVPMYGEVFLEDNAFHDGNGKILSAESGFSIEDIRYANSLQKWLERNARRGSRYIEAIKSHFGVTTPDYRLARPEFIGGGRQPITISEVLQTNSDPTSETPLGTYAGHGISSGEHNFSYTAYEHGYIIGLMRIVPRISYQNVMRKEFFKNDRFDFFWPEFAHLGEQSVKKYELNSRFMFVNKGNTDFGYQQRYAEYKFIPSTVHGAFRDDALLSNFTPALNIGGALDDANLNDFYVSQQNTAGFERVFAIPDYDPFLVSIIHNITAYRPIPYASTPKL